MRQRLRQGCDSCGSIPLPFEQVGMCWSCQRTILGCCMAAHRVYLCWDCAEADDFSISLGKEDLDGLDYWRFPLYTV